MVFFPLANILSQLRRAPSLFRLKLGLAEYFKMLFFSMFNLCLICKAKICGNCIHCRVMTFT
jgi:hypothetical protein